MNYAIVLSGGTGTRTGADMPKQYIRVRGHMMVTYALQPLIGSENVDKVLVVCSDDWYDSILKDAEEAGLDVSKIAGHAQPGDTRQLSILNGIRYIIEETQTAGSEDTVIIHDAARPFLTGDLIDRCYRALKEDGNADGVMPVLPMKDTVYLSDDGRKIGSLIDRSTVFAGQAPELFKLKEYYEANTRLLPDGIKKINGTSEPAVMAGMNIIMIPGDERNIKITSGEDLLKFKEV